MAAAVKMKVKMRLYKCCEWWWWKRTSSGAEQSLNCADGRLRHFGELNPEIVAGLGFGVLQTFYFYQGIWTWYFTSQLSQYFPLTDFI